MESFDLEDYRGRPFTGAWIETACLLPSIHGVSRRPFTGAWIETRSHTNDIQIATGRPFTGAWIETAVNL